MSEPVSNVERDAEDSLSTLWRKELVALQERMEQLEDARNTQKALRAADAEKHRVSVESLKSRIIDLKMALGDSADGWFKRYVEAQSERNAAWEMVRRLRKMLKAAHPSVPAALAVEIEAALSETAAEWNADE